MPAQGLEESIILRVGLQLTEFLLTTSIAVSINMFSSSPILALCLGWLAHAATVTYDFNITWLTANPDGLLDRPVMGINGQWPLPYITATVGDRIVVHVHNQLGNESTSLHFHGIYQNGTTEMDGVLGATQCPIEPGASFTYNFTVSPSATALPSTTDSRED